MRYVFNKDGIAYHYWQIEDALKEGRFNISDFEEITDEEYQMMIDNKVSMLSLDNQSSMLTEMMDIQAYLNDHAYIGALIASGYSDVTEFSSELKLMKEKATRLKEIKSELASNKMI